MDAKTLFNDVERRAPQLNESGRMVVLALEMLRRELSYVFLPEQVGRQINHAFEVTISKLMEPPDA